MYELQNSEKKIVVDSKQYRAEWRRIQTCRPVVDSLDVEVDPHRKFYNILNIVLDIVNP